MVKRSKKVYFQFRWQGLERHLIEIVTTLTQEIEVVIITRNIILAFKISQISHLDHRMQVH